MTNISGELGGMTLTAAGNPYHLIGNAQVSAGLTFETQEGVSIVVDGNYKIAVSGKVTLFKTTFESGQPSPAWGDWFGIELDAWDPTSNIQECTIRHATYGIYIVEEPP